MYETTCYVVPVVNPGSLVIPLKLFDDMPYSGIQMTSKRGVFAPLLSLLLLIEQFKLQPCELLLRLDIRLFNEQQAFNQIRFALA